VQLISREWVIADGRGAATTCRAKGVVGEQPVIEPRASPSIMSRAARCHADRLDGGPLPNGLGGRQRTCRRNPTLPARRADGGERHRTLINKRNPHECAMMEIVYA
jgi:hypothetical protein